MKVEYFDIQLRLNYMLRLPPEDREVYFKKLIPKLKHNWVRFEIFYEESYYTEGIKSWQKRISEYVAMGKYSDAAQARPNTIFFTKQLYFAEIYFQSQPPPSLHITESGLIRVRLHSEQDQKTIAIFRSF